MGVAIKGAAAFAAALLLAACSNAGSPSAPTLPGVQPAANHRSPSGKIKHVIILIQENRSFNNLFYGYKGAKTAKFGYDSNGNKVKLLPISIATSWDLDHSSNSFFAACNGTGSIPGTNCRMNGFDREYVGCGGRGQPACPHPEPQYSYVPHSQTKTYFEMAKRYVLADEMFASNFDASSFISHQYIIAGQASSAVNYPNGDWGCEGGANDVISTVGQERQIPYGSEQACFDNTTLGDELDSAGLPWAFYTASLYGDLGIWSAYQAISHIFYGPDWSQDVLTPQTQFFSDISNGKLRTVSWITPTWENSDHAGSNSTTGPSWVASVVNAVGESQYWDSTAIFIFWDDYGGWFDPVAPKMLDYDGLGLRIPMLIISPYAKKGHVSHVPYEHGSILRFVEDQFGLPQLSASDARATSPAADAFDFNKPPRKFVPFKSQYDRQYFLDQPSTGHPPDSQ